MFFLFRFEMAFGGVSSVEVSYALHSASQRAASRDVLRDLPGHEGGSRRFSPWKSYTVTYHPGDWYICLHENHKHQPFMWVSMYHTWIQKHGSYGTGKDWQQCLSPITTHLYLSKSI